MSAAWPPRRVEGRRRPLAEGLLRKIGTVPRKPSLRNPGRRRLAAGLLGWSILAASGCAESAPRSDRTGRSVPLPAEVVEPPECTGVVATVCGEMAHTGFVLIAGQFPGSDHLGRR